MTSIPGYSPPMTIMMEVCLPQISGSEPPEINDFKIMGDDNFSLTTPVRSSSFEGIFDSSQQDTRCEAEKYNTL